MSCCTDNTSRRMASLLLLNTLLLIFTVAQGYSLEENASFLETHESSSGILPHSLEHAKRLRLRRDAAPQQGQKKKPSLFDRILSRMTQIRDSHPSHKRLTNTKKSYRRPSTYRRYRRPASTYRRHSHKRSRYVRPTYRRSRPTYRRSTITATRRVPSSSKNSGSKKKLSIFQRIMSKVEDIKKNHRHTHTRINNRRPVEKKPERKWSSKSKPIEVSPVERKPERKWSHKPKPIEVSPVERKPERKWSHKRKPIEVSPVERKPERKWSHKSKPIEVSPAGLIPGVAAGVTTYALARSLKTAYKGEEKKLMKVVSWNVYEGKSPRNSLNIGRREICSKIKAMNPTVFGLQRATMDQMTRIHQCLPRSKYGIYRGSTRYDRSINRHLYNPIFYQQRNKQLQSKTSGSIYMLDERNARHFIGSYMRIEFSTKDGTSTTKRNNIKDLWKRIGNLVNNPHRRSSASSSTGGKTEVLIANTYLRDVAQNQMEKQLKFTLSKVHQFSRYGRNSAILMGDLKTKGRSALYHTVVAKKLDNHIKRKNVSNTEYVLNSKLKTVYATVINDRLYPTSYKPFSHKPLFVAYEMP